MLSHPRRPILVALAIAVLCVVGPLRADTGLGDIRFTHVQEDHGLAHADVRAIEQDQAGFIWLGFRIGGLARFDGYELKVYEHDPANPSSLGNRVIWSLLVDRRGTLWIGTEGGLDRFDPETETFHHYRHDPTNPRGLPNNVVISLFEDKDGNVWAGTRRGLARLDDASTGTFTTYLRPQVIEGSSANDTFRSLTEDPTTGLFWLGTSDGLAAFDPRTGAFATFIHDPEDRTSLSHNSVNKVMRASDGTFWAFTEHGLNAFKPTFASIPQHVVQEPHLSFRRYFHPDGSTRPGVNYFRDAVIDRQDRLWVASRGGLQVFDRTSETFTTFSRRPGDIAGISDNIVQAVFEDAHGNLWIGTHGGGANVVRASAKPFRIHRHQPGNENSLNDNRITGLAFDQQGRLWAATAEGLNRFDGEYWTRFVPHENDADTVPNFLLSALAVAPNGDVWMGTPYHGPLRFDGEHVQRFTARNATAPAADGFYRFTGNQVNSLLPDDRGGIWIGARAYGIDYYNDGLFRHFRPHLSATDEAPSRPIANAIFGVFGNDGTVWFATEGGRLIRFDPQTEQFTAFEAPTNIPGTSRSLLCIADGGGGVIWIGAADGLLGFDTRSNTFTHNITTGSGLPHHAVLSIVRDRRGFLWLGTGHGLAELNPTSGHFRFYEKADGLPGNAFSERAGVLGPDGRVYLGTRSGLVEFRPEELRDNVVPPPVVLTELRWLGPAPEQQGRRAPSVAHVGQRIVVPPGQLGFSLRYAALDFTAPEKNRYRHRLEGWESDWVQRDAAERSATYTALPPGTYTFRVQGSNADARWNDAGASVEIIVQPRLWQTVWFRVLAGALLLALLISALQWRLRGVRRRNALLEEQVSHRTAQLQEEVVVRQRAEAALRESHTDLERRVQVRTAELARANAELQSEIAERKNIEAQLRQSQKMEAIGQLAGGVAHDFNNLLTVILGQIDLMESTDLSPEMRADAVRDITAAAQRASNLTRQLLVFSRQQAMSPSPLNLNRVVTDVSKLLNHVIGERITLENVLHPEPLCVQGDAGMLEQVLLNMALNARDAMPRGGQLRLITSAVELSSRAIDGVPHVQPGPYARVSVSDSGLGIPEDILPRIFDPFFTTKDAGKGTGLGLAISLDIIQQHGGWIDVESREGHGTTFHVHLPARRPVAATAAPGQTHLRHSRGDTTILLAEDESAVRAVVRTVLTRQGYCVIEASSGSEALRKWSERRDEIALLLTDIVMPGSLDGHELAARLQSERPSIRVITMSGYDPREASTASHNGRPHLRKPFTADDLLGAVETALGR